MGSACHGHFRMAAHAARFLTGSYKPPREFNWVVGVILAGIDLASEFYRISFALGSASDLGDHGGIEHGARHTVFG